MDGIERRLSWSLIFSSWNFLWYANEYATNATLLNRNYTFSEGLNGRLPNQDLLNSFQKISVYTGGVPVTVYDHYERGEFPERDLADIPSWVPSAAKNTEAVKEYAYRAKNVLRHVSYQARGRASGVHGLMHQ